MGIPTIVAIAPAGGPTGGHTLVEIAGTNFKVPDDPPLVGPVPDSPATVSVTFGGTAALVVRVLSSTLLTALTPAHDTGDVDVVVSNLAAGGTVIPGETVTEEDGYTYARPAVATGVQGALSTSTRILRALIIALRQQVIANVVPMVHTEYDDIVGGIEVAMLSKLPGLTVAGPEFVENRENGTNEEQEVEDGDATYRSMRVTQTFDLVFNLTGAADTNAQILGLIDAVQDFLDRNHSITIDRNPDDPNDGTVSYVLHKPLGESFRVTSAPNEANVRSFVGVIVVQGVTREGLASVDGDLARERGGRTTEDGASIQIDGVE